jgi:mono/diheme cytochrome c family protein
MHMRVRASLTADETASVLAVLASQSESIAVPAMHPQVRSRELNSDSESASRFSNNPANEAEKPVQQGPRSVRTQSGSPSGRAAQSKQNPSKASMTAGRHLFQDMKCATCHSIVGEGGNVGPSLDTIAQKLSRAELRAKIKAGGTVMPPLPPDTSPEQLNQPLDYLEYPAK